ncbi:CDP-alcohol phosphatidyltransferase family protein [Gardnerella vaginalis]|uniref:CDP-alcohol phosphatidyltransferase family protein n=1 Tax=Gardnerella vaginalis TaxID=2702 RepID=UPI0039711692
MLESLRGGFKRVIAPIAKLLVKFGCTANGVTVFGALAVVVTSIFVSITGWLLFGTILLTIFVLADALDGSVAALTNQNGGTKFGAFLDSTLDRIADWSLFLCVCICLYRAKNINICLYLPEYVNGFIKYCGLVCSLIAIMAAFVTSYARARGESVGVEAKKGLITRADRVAIILISMGLSGLTGWLLWLSLAMLILCIGGVITVIQRIFEVKNLLKNTSV